MNNLCYTIKSKFRRFAQRGDLNMLYIFPVATGAVVLITVLFLVFLTPYNRVYVIDDSDYVRSLGRQAIPVSIDLYDPVWGSITIQDLDKAYYYYETICNLPKIEFDEMQIKHGQEHNLLGSINFLERSSITFQISNTIVVEGVTYGSTNAMSEVGFMLDDIYNEFHTTENLAGLVNRSVKTMIRVDNQRIEIPTEIRKMLREEIRSGRQIEDSGELSRALQKRGESIFQIEVYLEEEKEGINSIPQVYISVYDNDLCVVYDVESAVGSDMHIFCELNSLLNLINETRGGGVS